MIGIDLDRPVVLRPTPAPPLQPGVATEANLAGLKEMGYRYLVVSRERTRHFDPERAICIQNAAGDALQLKNVLSEEGDEVRL